MNNLLYHLLILLVLISCGPTNNPGQVLPNPVNWDRRAANLTDTENLLKGSSYLSVYSEIYSINERSVRSLTTTVSLRNTNSSDTVYLFAANYFNTQGDKIKSYIEQPVFIAPMETLEIVIGTFDTTGGTGANFVFEWGIQQSTNEPFFEAVMLYITGAQGLAFTTQGIRIDRK